MATLSVLRNFTRSFSHTIQPFKAIPTTKGLPMIGTLFDIVRNGGVSQIHRYIDKRHRQLGPIFREKLGHVEAVWLSDPVLFQQAYQQEGVYPELMLPEPWVIFNKKHGYKRGLFFMQGEEWASTRKLLGPLLLKMASVQSHLKSFDLIADHLVNGWRSRQDGLIDNLESDLYFYFVQGLICAMFGEKVGLNRSILEAHLPGMVQSLHSLFEYSAQLTLVPPSLAAKFELKVWKNFEQSAQQALKIAETLTVTCLKELETMEKHKVEQTECVVTLLSKSGMKQADIQRIVADLILAAADTTSHSTQWALYLLSRHYEIQEKAAAEIKAAQNSGSESFEASHHSSTLKGCVKEALRLYPVATFLTRILPEDSVIGNFKIPAKTLVLLSLYSSGRHEKYFSDPLAFNPGRWDRKINKHDSNLVKDPFASLPFGHGKRACIGRRLAEAQMYTLLGKVVCGFHLKSENEVEMAMRLLGTVNQPVRLKLESRP